MKTDSAGFELVMPSNYIPWGGPGPEERQIQQIEPKSSRLILIILGKCVFCHRLAGCHKIPCYD